MHTVTLSRHHMQQERSRWSCSQLVWGEGYLAHEGIVLMGQHFEPAPGGQHAYLFLHFSGRGRFTALAYNERMQELIDALYSRGFLVDDYDPAPDTARSSLAAAQAMAATGATVILTPSVHAAAREAGLAVGRTVGGLPCLGGGR